MNMFSIVSGTVVRILKDHPELQELLVTIERDGEIREERAYNYPGLYRRIEPGERVKMNSAAVELGLGTGGRHFVLPDYPERQSVQFKGHIMKLRYTPWQTPILAAEEEHSPYHQGLVSKTDLDGTPVVAAGLHSMLPGIILGFRESFNRDPKVAYIMTDGAALPLALSDLVRELKSKGLLNLTVTAGNAFGGDLEAVSIPSALVAAKEAIQPDLIIVALGPGIVGTGTRLGFSGVEQSWIVDLTARLGGKAVLAPRISGADPRERHRGISHHTLTVLNLASQPPLLPLSTRLSEAMLCQVKAAAIEAQVWDRAQWYLVDDPAAEDLFAKYEMNVRSMGRGVRDDPAFFQATVAAGFLAGIAAAGELAHVKQVVNDG